MVERRRVKQGAAWEDVGMCVEVGVGVDGRGREGHQSSLGDTQWNLTAAQDVLIRHPLEPSNKLQFGKQNIIPAKFSSSILQYVM